MALSEHYEFRYLDPDAALSDFPSQWDHVIDKIDTGIHDAATAPVSLSRLPNLPASKTTSGKFAQARIPNLPASQIDSGRFPEARMSQAILDRLDKLERSTGERDITAMLSETPKSGTVTIRRTGDLCILTFNRVVLADPGSVIRIIEYIPKGFRPENRSEVVTGGGNGESTHGILQVDTSGAVFLHGANDGESNRAVAIYMTSSDWPSTLPGDPA